MSDLRKALIKLAHSNPELRADLLPLLKTGASGYNWNGKTLTKREMLSQAQAKEVVFMGNKKTPTYHAVMEMKGGTNATVFPISKGEFERLKVKDISTPQQKKKALEHEYEALKKKKLRSMSDKVDFNTWAKEKNRSTEELVEKLRKMA